MVGMSFVKSHEFKQYSILYVQILWYLYEHFQVRVLIIRENIFCVVWSLSLFLVVTNYWNWDKIVWSITIIKSTFRVKFMNLITKNSLKKIYVYVNFNNFCKYAKTPQVHGTIAWSLRFFRNFFTSNPYSKKILGKYIPVSTLRFYLSFVCRINAYINKFK